MKNDYRETAQKIIDAGLFDAAVNFMDDEIREELHGKLAPCDEVTFLAAYLEAHENKYGQELAL